MNFFGGRSGVVLARSRGDTSKLPMQLEISGSRLNALGKLGAGAVLILLGYNLTGDPTNQSQFGSFIEVMFQAAPYIIILVGLAVFAQGVYSFTARKTVFFENGQVHVSGRTVFGGETWSEDLNAFEGVRWREIVVHRRNRLSGNNSTRVRPRIYQVLDLQHRDSKRCIPLYVTQFSEEAGQAFRKLSEIIDINEETRGKLGSQAGRIDALQETTRSKWEHFARLLGVPAIDARNGAQLVRASEDVDKSVKELADEGKIQVEWDGSAPPAGLEVAYEGDSDNPDTQIIHVTIRAKKFPVWVYGGLLVFCGVFLLLGVVDLAAIPIIFGGGLAAGVVWHWRSEDRNPRSVRITRSMVLLETPNPGNATRSDAIEHQAIESVEFSGRHDRSVIGSQIAIATDQREFKVGSGLSKEALGWLRDLIRSAVAKA